MTLAPVITNTYQKTQSMQVKNNMIIREVRSFYTNYFGKESIETSQYK